MRIVYLRFFDLLYKFYFNKIMLTWKIKRRWVRGGSGGGVIEELNIRRILW